MIPIVGVTASMPEKASYDKTDKNKNKAPGPQEAPQYGSKCCCIIPTLVPILDVPSTSSTSSYPIAMVPELVILVEAYPEITNRPSGGKDYLCHLCSFQHTNYDCMLTHIRKHLNITIGCPGCDQVSRMLLHYASMKRRCIKYELQLLLRNSDFPSLLGCF